MNALTETMGTAAAAAAAVKRLPRVEPLLNVSVQVSFSWFIERINNKESNQSPAPLRQFK